VLIPVVLFVVIPLLGLQELQNRDGSNHQHKVFAPGSIAASSGAPTPSCDHGSDLLAAQQAL
jgi:hypothetical protein